MQRHIHVAFLDFRPGVALAAGEAQETAKALSANPPSGFMERAALYEYDFGCYFERSTDAFAGPLHTG